MLPVHLRLAARAFRSGIVMSFFALALPIANAQIKAWEVNEYGANARPTALFGSDDADGALNKKALDVDGSGNSVMVGRWFSGANFDWLIIKHDSNGAVVWRSSLNGQANGDDWAFAVKRDSVGNYLVAGHTTHFSSNGAQRCTIAKFDRLTGAELWRVNPLPPNIPSTTTAYTSSQCLTLTVDSDGNAYASGRVRTGDGTDPNTGNLDAYAVKVNTSGATQWSKVYQGTYAGATGAPRDSAAALITSYSNTAIYLGMRLNNNAVGDMDWAIRRLDSAGNETGAIDVAAGANDRPRAIAVSADGTRLAVGGFITSIDGLRGSIRLFDTSNLAVALANLVFGAAGGDHRISDVSFDASNIAYYSGASWIGASGTQPAQMRIWATKLSSSGAFIWGSSNNVFNPSLGQYTEGLAHAVDSSGNLYAAGVIDPATPVPSTSTTGTATANFLVVKFNGGDGSVGDVRQLDGPAGLIDGAGNSKRDRAHAIAIGEAGKLYVAGNVTENGANGGRLNFGLAKLDIATGGLNPVWSPSFVRPSDAPMSLRIGSLDTILAKKTMKVDLGGNVYTASRGHNGANSDIVVTKHNANGVLVWKAIYDSSVNPSDSFTDLPHALVLDAAGNAYVVGNAGGIDNGQTTPYKMVVLRFNAVTGNRDWTRLIASPTATLNAYGTDIAIAPSGNSLYVVGESEAATDANGVTAASSSNFFTTRLNIFTGATDWTRQDDFGQSAGQRAFHVAVDPVNANVLYVGGRANLGSDNASNANFAMGVIKYVDNTTAAAPAWSRTIDNGAGPDIMADMHLRVGGAGTLYLVGWRPNATDSEIVLHTLTALNTPTPTVTSVAVNGSNNLAGTGDSGYSVITDPAGNIYLAGLLNNTAGQEGFTVVKFNVLGVEQWRKVLNPTTGNNFDTAYAVAMTVDGPVVSGMLFDGTFFMGSTLLRASDGEMMWFVEHDSPARDIGLAVQVVPSGTYSQRVVVGGWGGKNARNQTLTLQAIDRAACTLKVDGRGSAPLATSDGLIILRRIIGLDEPIASAGTSPLNDIETRENLVTTLGTRGDYDVDLSGATDFKDALLILRYMLGFTGSSVTDGLGLSGSRNQWLAPSPTINNSIKTYLDSCGTL
jgi:hypothetical protein